MWCLLNKSVLAGHAYTNSSSHNMLQFSKLMRLYPTTKNETSAELYKLYIMYISGIAIRGTITMTYSGKHIICINNCSFVIHLVAILNIIYVTIATTVQAAIYYYALFCVVLWELQSNNEEKGIGTNATSKVVVKHCVITLFQKHSWPLWIISSIFRI